MPGRQPDVKKEAREDFSRQSLSVENSEIRMDRVPIDFYLAEPAFLNSEVPSMPCSLFTRFSSADDGALSRWAIDPTREPGAFRH